MTDVGDGQDDEEVYHPPVNDNNILAPSKICCEQRPPRDADVVLSLRMSRTRTSGRDRSWNGWKWSGRGKFLDFPSVDRRFGWRRVGFGDLLPLPRFSAFHCVWCVGCAELCPLHALLTLRLVIGPFPFRSLRRHGSESGWRKCRKRQEGFKLFPSPSSPSLHRRNLYATATDSTLSSRHHEPAARCRRTKHSDVEGQETNQKPRRC